MAQMDLTLPPPPGAAFYVHIDGTIRLRFDSSQAEKILPWAHEWLRVIEHYIKRRGAGSIPIADMPKNLEEINALVAKLNAQLATERAETEPAQKPEPAIMATPAVNPDPPKRVQCPTCLGVGNFPDEPICVTCNGEGSVNAG